MTAVFAPAQAQTRNPYYDLQCSMSGAYCDRVYAAPTRPESFDELLERKARERAERERDRAERDAREQEQREQERLAREERQRQVLLAREQERERYRLMIAERTASAPLIVSWFRSGWPVPQWIVAGLILAFGTIAYIGRRTSSRPQGLDFFALGSLSLLCLPFTYGASEAASPGFALLAMLVPAFAFMTWNGLNAVRGYHYLFVAHPPAFITIPLRERALFPKHALAQALRPNAAHLADPPPAYQSRNLLAKARALREKIDADADIADAAMRRDRARAQQIRAEAELREILRRLPWWKRWLWR